MTDEHPTPVVLQPSHDRITRWAAVVCAVILCSLLVLGVIAAVTSPSIDARLADIRARQEALICLMLLDENDRTQEALNACTALVPG